MVNPKLVIGLMSLMILVMACAQSQSAPPQQTADKTIGRSSESGKVAAVAIKGFKFVPADANIKVGETVVWTNEDNAVHTVESSDGTLKSDELAQGDTYKFTFTKAGKYDYNCGIHKNMHGSVTVQ